MRSRAAEALPIEPCLPRALRAAAFAYAISRLIIFVTMIVASAVATHWSPENDQDTNVRLLTEGSIDHLKSRILANDASWYLSISTSGYEERQFDASRAANWAFFPLFPWLWKSLLSLGADAAWSGFLLSNVLFLLGLIQLHRWVQTIRDTDVADRAVLVIALFPTAYFFSLPWSESLFLFLASSTLISLQQKQLSRASIWNALLSACRPTGLFYSALLWWENREGHRLPPFRIWLFAVLGTLGLLVFMSVLHLRTGNALAFVDIQAAWGRDGGSLTKHFRRWVMDPLLLAEPWNLRWLNNTALLLGLAASAWLWRQKLRGFAILSFLCIFMPWSTGTLVSMSRYLLTIPPLFLAFACWLESPRLFQTWIAISSALLTGLSLYFTLGLSLAGA